MVTWYVCNPARDCGNGNLTSWHCTILITLMLSCSPYATQPEIVEMGTWLLDTVLFSSLLCCPVPHMQPSLRLWKWEPDFWTLNYSHHSCVVLLPICILYFCIQFIFKFTRHSLDLSGNVVHDGLFPHHWCSPFLISNLNFSLFLWTC